MEQSSIIKLSEADLEWLRANYADLQITQEDQTVTAAGLLGFDAYFNSQTGKMLYNPPDEYHENKYRIQDVFEIEIKFLKNGESILPQVREIGGRLEQFAQKSGIPTIDLHVQPATSTLCLCPRQEEKRRMPSGINLDVLFNELIVPFFYSHSFFEKYNERPWKDYSHGAMGTLEHFARTNSGNDKSLVISTLEALEEDQPAIDFYSLRLRGVIKLRKTFCPQHPKVKFKDCEQHKEAYRGLEILKAEAEHFQIDLI